MLNHRRRRQRPQVGFDFLTDFRELRTRPAEMARVVDERLRILGRAEHELNRAIGLSLMMMADRSAFIKLGFANLATYADEVLGLGARRAQELAQLERALVDRPAMSAAYDANLLTYSSVRLLIRETPVEDEAIWSHGASALTVHEVGAMIAEVKRQTQGGSEQTGEAASDLSGGQPDGTSESDQISGARGQRAAVDPIAAENLTAGPQAGGDPTESLPGGPIEDEPRGRWICFGATRAVAARWLAGLELARRKEGSLSPADALEMWMAEFITGEGAPAYDAAVAARYEAEAREQADPDRPHPSDVLPWNHEFSDLRHYAEYRIMPS